MSLGWQCESAILPSKAKPIVIDSTSILGLKALVYSEEQKLSKNIPTNSRHLGAHKSKTLNVAFTDRFENKKVKNIVANPYNCNNILNDEEEKEARVLKSLTAKSKLYEEIKNGSMSGVSSVLNFECRSEVQKNNVPVTLHQSENNNLYDEFGRINQYQWSTGQESASDVYKNEKALERHFYQTVEERLRETPPPSSNKADTKEEHFTSSKHGLASNGDGAHMSSAARVKTQWEKTLNNSARGYLDEVHRDAQTERGLQAAATAGSYVSTSSGLNKKRSAREDRLEMLKLKQQRVVSSGVTGGQ